METLTRTELMLVKSCVIDEKRALEVAIEKLHQNTMGPIDITNYAYMKNLLTQYETILKKLG